MFELFFHLSVQLSLVFPGNSRNTECERFLEKKKSLRTSLEKSGVLTWKNLLDSFIIIWLVKTVTKNWRKVFCCWYKPKLLCILPFFCLCITTVFAWLSLRCTYLLYRLLVAALVGCGKVGLLISGSLRCDLLTFSAFTHIGAVFVLKPTRFSAVWPFVFSRAFLWHFKFYWTWIELNWIIEIIIN